jgi:cytochrome c-type biogenesis protein
MQSPFLVLLEIGTSFGIGLYTALSPCLFPLLPLFLLRTLSSSNSRRRAVTITLVLVAGILASLAIFWAISGLIGIYLVQNKSLIQAVFGVVIIIFGIITVSDKLRQRLGISGMNLAQPPENPSSLASVFAIGLGYSLMAAPCSGSALFAAFIFFGSQANVLLLGVLFVAMAIGVGIPYLLIALISSEGRDKLASSFASYARYVEIAVGVLLVVMGVVLMLPYFGILVF